MYLALFVISAGLLSVLCTEITRQLALRWQWLDKPSQRSAHKKITPRGGGLAFCLLIIMSLMFSPIFSFDSRYLLFILSLVFITAIGLTEDILSIRPSIRLLLQSACAMLAISALEPYLPWHFGPMTFMLEHTAFILFALLFFLWAINLYNFMDGIDGLAASQGVFVLASTASLIVYHEPQLGFSLFLCSAFIFGFLVLNWMPARLFMGDVGSCFLGFLLASLALITSQNELLNIWVWLILMSYFITDSTVTIIYRLFRKENIFQAHNQHTYQILARRQGRHDQVVYLILKINVFWCLPCAYIAANYTEYAVFSALVCFLPLCLMCTFICGRAHRKMNRL